MTEKEMILKGQKHWKSMPVLSKYKRGRIETSVLKELIDLIVDDVWNNAKEYYINK
jgi:hypothetical protein